MPFNKILLTGFLLFGVFSCYSQTPSTNDSTVEIDVRNFEKVEVEASYPGGDAGWLEFLQKNLNPNIPVDNGAPIGRYTVYVEFVVKKDGSVSDIKALTHMGYGMEKEVIDLIKKSGVWNPAVQDGRKVNAYRKQPVTFMVTTNTMFVDSEVPYVLFTGKDNEITITAHKVKGEDITMTISPGTAKPLGNGKFIIKVNKPGKATAFVFGKKGKQLETINFEVREAE